MDQFALYNKDSPPWRRVSRNFMMALFVSALVLLMGALFCLIASSEEPFRTISVVLGVSIMMILAVMGSVFMLIASTAGLRQKAMVLNKDYTFQCHEALNYLSWSYERASLLACNMGAALILLVASGIAIWVMDASFLWLLSYIFLLLSCLVIALLLPMQLRAWRYLGKVKRYVGNIDQAASQLPPRLLESARSYALYNGHSGVLKAIKVAFVGNHFADAINAHQQAARLSENTKDLAVAHTASRKRL